MAAAQRVARRAAIAEADVEVAVGAERKLAAVVVLVGLRDLEDDEFAVGVGLGVGRRQGEPRNDRAARVGCRIVDVEMPFIFRGVSGGQCQPQQSLLRAAGSSPGRLCPGNLQQRCRQLSAALHRTPRPAPACWVTKNWPPAPWTKFVGASIALGSTRSSRRDSSGGVTREGGGDGVAALHPAPKAASRTIRIVAIPIIPAILHTPRSPGRDFP